MVEACMAESAFSQNTQQEFARRRTGKRPQTGLFKTPVPARTAEAAGHSPFRPELLQKTLLLVLLLPDHGALGNGDHGF